LPKVYQPWCNIDTIAVSNSSKLYAFVGTHGCVRYYYNASTGALIILDHIRDILIIMYIQLYEIGYSYILCHCLYTYTVEHDQQDMANIMLLFLICIIIEYMDDNIECK